MPRESLFLRSAVRELGAMCAHGHLDNSTQEPDVTVLMGVFNGLPELEQSIRSILAQTFGDFEFLIIDDGSTDGSDRLIRRYAEHDHRIRLSEERDQQGLGAVLNRGVREARGQIDREDGR